MKLLKTKITIALAWFVALAFGGYQLYAQLAVPYAPAGLLLVGVYSQSLTPAASSAAIQTAEQTFTVNGLTTNDIVVVTGPAPTSLCPPVAARVSAANTLNIAFTTLTAVACTPASGTYLITAFRRGG